MDMKKIIIASLALFLIAVGGMAFGVKWVNSYGDNVAIEEIVLSGDKTAAEGITITTTSQHEGTPIKWETIYTAGIEPEVSARFQYQKRRPKDYVEKESDVSFHTYPWDDEEWDAEYGSAVIDFEEDLGTPEELVMPVVENTKAGSLHQETVYLQDRIPYYDVHLSFYITNGTDTEYSSHDREDAAAYFQIPISEDDRLSIKVKKMYDGSCKFVRIAPKKISRVLTSGIVHDDAIYLFMTDMESYIPHMDKVEQVTLPERICGLHKIPYTEVTSGYGYKEVKADFDNAELITPMEQGGQVLSPFFSEDGEELRAFFIEDEKIYLLIFDVETFELRQKIYLTDCGEIYFYENSFAVKDAGNHMLVTMVNNQFSFLTKDKNGNWKLEVTDKLLLKDIPEFLGDERVAFAYDGKKLVIACMDMQDFFVDDWQAPASFQLSIYEKNQRIYDGFYKNSLDYPDFVAGPVGNSPITVSLLVKTK